MLNALLGGNKESLDINSSSSVWAIIWISFIATHVFIVQPGFVQGLIEYVGFTEEFAGLLATWEMWGIAAGTVLVISIASKVSWRLLTLAFIIMCVVGNALSIGQASYDTLRFLRFLTGVGAGGMIAITFIMAGLTARADRNFALIIVLVLSYGTIVMWGMPRAYQSIGMNGMLIFFCLFCLTGLYFLRNLPDAGEAHADLEGDYNYASWLRFLTLAGILVFNVGIGIVWVFLFPVGLETGMTEQGVANVIMISQLFGIAGALFVVFNEVRFGRLVPLMFGMVAIAFSIFLLLGDTPQRNFWFAVCGFNLLWNIIMPYTLSTAGDFDARGKTVGYAISLQMIGLAIGPYIATRLLSTGGFDAGSQAAIVAFLAAAVLMLPGVLAQRGRLANAAA